MKTKKTKLSLKDWKKVYFPTKPSKRMSILTATKHCLRKWEGLLPDIRKKYNLTLEEHYLTDKNGDGWIEIDQTTCALCSKFFYDDGCDKCPIGKLNKTCGCDGSPYQHFLNKKDPSKMIRLLKYIILEITVI